METEVRALRKDAASALTGHVMKESRQHTKMNKLSEKIDECIATLKDLANDAALLANLPDEQLISLLKISYELSRPDRRERKKRNKTVDKTARLTTLEKDLR